MPGATSGDPRRRARSLANLRRGNPAPEGNDYRATHRAYMSVAEDRLSAKVRAVFDALAADAPLRDESGGLPAADAAQVRLAAEALCRLEDVGAFLTRFGLFDSKTKQLRPAVEVEAKLRREAADHLDALGMTPRSRAKLGVDTARAFDLAQQWADENDDAQDGDVIDGEATDA